MQRFVNLTFVGRDALLVSWREDEALVRVYAYRVFETQAGFGVAGQTVDRDRHTDTLTQAVPPTQLHDGFVSEGLALDWMQQRANEKLSHLVETFQVQGETVLMVRMEDVYAAE